MAGNITMRDVRIIYRNFSGKGTDYNPEGRRNFSVVIEDEALANQLLTDGWNVKPLKQREEGEPLRWQLPVAVGYNLYPPTIVTVSNVTGEQTRLTEDNVNTLDWEDILKVDLTIRPYHYNARGNSGIKAYLKTMYVTINEDELAAEYAKNDHFDDDVPF